MLINYEVQWKDKDVYLIGPWLTNEDWLQLGLLIDFKDLDFVVNGNIQSSHVLTDVVVDGGSGPIIGEGYNGLLYSIVIYQDTTSVVYGVVTSPDCGEGGPWCTDCPEEYCLIDCDWN